MAAWESVKKLNALQPDLVVPGHGQYMEGAELKTGLEQLAAHFDTDAIPAHGKYVEERDKLAH
jgi:glyoxylase-like metal-dependent hydrolase (beta-lactamase superfamily II)